LNYKAAEPSPAPWLRFLSALRSLGNFASLLFPTCDLLLLQSNNNHSVKHRWNWYSHRTCS